MTFSCTVVIMSTFVSQCYITIFKDDLADYRRWLEAKMALETSIAEYVLTWLQ